MISIWKQIGAFCDCPCDDLVDNIKPKMISMALPYITQAVVVTIVGLNMGLRSIRVSPEWGWWGWSGVCAGGCNTLNCYYRKANLDIWKKMLKSKRTKVSGTPLDPGMSSLNSNEEWRNNKFHFEYPESRVSSLSLKKYISDTPSLILRWFVDKLEYKFIWTFNIKN